MYCLSDEYFTKIKPASKLRCKSVKRKRRHIPHSERSADFVHKRNERERTRVKVVNQAFENLRNKIPVCGQDSEFRISKMEILTSAIDYIEGLSRLLGYENFKDLCTREKRNQQAHHVGYQPLSNDCHFGESFHVRRGLTLRQTNLSIRTTHNYLAVPSLSEDRMCQDLYHRTIGHNYMFNSSQRHQNRNSGLQDLALEKENVQQYPSIFLDQNADNHAGFMKQFIDMEDERMRYSYCTSNMNFETSDDKLHSIEINDLTRFDEKQDTGINDRFENQFLFEGSGFSYHYW